MASPENLFASMMVLSVFDSVRLGFAYGVLHAVAPDHIGTLIALSAAAGETDAFRVGGIWGLTHSMGMVLVCAAFVPLQSVIPNATVEAWSHFGDYVVGLTMVLCGLYFITREASYMQQTTDGTYLLITCSCHAHTDTKNNQEKPSRKPKKVRFCEYGAAIRCDSAQLTSFPSAGLDAEKGILQSGLPCNGDPPLTDLRSGLLGLVQGVCCPIGVVGITVAADIPTWHRMLVFLATYFVFSALGTGAISHCWARFIRAGPEAPCTPTIAYRCSCYVTLAMGVSWIVANALGYLDRHILDTKTLFAMSGVSF